MCHTLYHVRGRFCADMSPFVHSIGGTEFGDPRFMSSPFSPTYVIKGKSEPINGNYWSTSTRDHSFF